MEDHCTQAYNININDLKLWHICCSNDIGACFNSVAAWRMASKVWKPISAWNTIEVEAHPMA